MNLPTPPADLDPAIREQLGVLEQSSPGLLRRLVDSFIARQSRAVLEAERQLQAGDLAGLRMTVHSLKGSSASLGATALASRAGEIERSAMVGDAESCRRLITDLPVRFASAERALRAWIDGS